MWQRKYVESFPNILRKNFSDWQAYQERKDGEWYELMEDFAKQINENNAMDNRNKEEIKRALILIKSLIESKNKEDNSTDTQEMSPKSEPLIIPQSFRGWLKFLLYDCPKYSLSSPKRRKFLSDLVRIIRLLFLVIVTALLFLFDNDNRHVR